MLQRRSIVSDCLTFQLGILQLSKASVLKSNEVKFTLLWVEMEPENPHWQMWLWATLPTK